MRIGKERERERERKGRREREREYISIIRNKDRRVRDKGIEGTSERTKEIVFYVGEREGEERGEGERERERARE